MTVYKRCKQGSFHRSKRMTRQDACCVVSLGDTLVLAAADGHSCACRAGYGARIACAVAVRLLTGGIEPQGFAPALKEGFDRMVDKHLRRRPLTETELASLKGADPLQAYGSTLLAALCTPESVTVFQIGDGEIHLLDEEGAFLPPLPEDPHCVGTATSSLCYPKEEAVAHLRWAQYPSAAALLLATDGFRHRLSRPYEAAQLLLTPEEEREASFRTLMDACENGDDQTVLLAFSPEKAEDEGFRSGLLRTLEGRQRELTILLLRREESQLQSYMTTAGQTLDRLKEAGDTVGAEAFLQRVRPRAQRLQAVQAALAAL